jgi:hypothetical protein
MVKQANAWPLKIWSNSFSRNVGNISNERRSHWHSGGSPKSPSASVFAMCLHIIFPSNSRPPHLYNPLRVSNRNGGVSYFHNLHACRLSQWPHSLRHKSTAAHLLRLWVRITPGAWMFFCCEFCLLSGRGQCDEMITRPQESYRLWCVVVCDIESSRMRRP